MKIELRTLMCPQFWPFLMNYISEGFNVNSAKMKFEFRITKVEVITVRHPYNSTATIFRAK
jgi:hypothetical protein